MRRASQRCARRSQPAGVADRALPPLAENTASAATPPASKPESHCKAVTQAEIRLCCKALSGNASCEMPRIAVPTVWVSAAEVAMHQTSRSWDG